MRRVKWAEEDQKQSAEKSQPQPDSQAERNGPDTLQIPPIDVPQEPKDDVEKTDLGELGQAE